MAAEEATPALFSDESLKMTDKCARIFEHFDKDNDGTLNFQELSALQLATAGTVLAPRRRNEPRATKVDVQDTRRQS